MIRTRKEQVRRVLGLAAAIGTTLQCTLGVAGFLVVAYQSGPGPWALPLFFLGSAAMTCWTIWSLLKEDGVEWCAFVPNALGAIGNALVSAVIVMGNW